MKEECGNCRFYGTRQTKYFKDDGTVGMKSGYGKCRRYPQAIDRNDGMWCGEYSQEPFIEKNKEESEEDRYWDSRVRLNF